MLTKEQILEKCHITNLDDVRNINLWGCDLENIDIISQLPNVEMVSLSCNNISSLKPFSFCPRLRELYLRKNKISDPDEFKHLSNCKELKILWLEENPVCENDNYRSQVLDALPQLSKLDNIAIDSSNLNANEDNKPLSPLDSIANPTETKSSLRMTQSARPKNIPSMNMSNEEDYLKKLDNIDDIKNFFSNGYTPSNINANNNMSNINSHPNPNEFTTNSLTSSNNKKDYLVSETLLNAQQMKFTGDLPPNQSPVKVFSYDGNKQQNPILNHRNIQYANNDININYHNFKQVPLNKNNSQDIPYEAKENQFNGRDSNHTVDPIPISDSLSNISPRNYHLMTAILNLMEDLSVKELIYVRSKIANLLDDAN